MFVKRNQKNKFECQSLFKSFLLSLTKSVLFGMLFLGAVETIIFLTCKAKVMKQLCAILSAVVLLIACKPKAETDQTKVLSAVDSAEFAAFQEWKEQQEAEKNQEVKTVYVVQKQNTSTASNNATTSTRKKWSNATKGAVIGGVGGAIVGGVVSKRNRAAGAVIGGVVGGGAGYGIGKTYDNKQHNQ